MEIYAVMKQIESDDYYSESIIKLFEDEGDASALFRVIFNSAVKKIDVDTTTLTEREIIMESKDEKIRIYIKRCKLWKTL